LTKNSFISKASTTVNAPASKVWDALTNPAIIKQYMLGTQVTSDWKVGSSIVYKGEWQGKSKDHATRASLASPLNPLT